MKSIEVRAFRGDLRSSTYRTYEVADSDFHRIGDVARSLDLPVLGSLDCMDRGRLDQEDASRLAEETTRLRVSGKLLELDQELVQIASLARWCQHRGRAWMTVEARHG